jgi:hypothetical protein
MGWRGFAVLSLVLGVVSGCSSTVAELRSSPPLDSVKLRGDYKKIMECTTAKMTGPNVTPLYFDQERRATLTFVTQGDFNRTRGVLEIVLQQTSNDVVQYELRVGQGVYHANAAAIRKPFADCSEGVVT